MKLKLITLITLSSIVFSFASVANADYLDAAQKLADMWVINNNSSNPSNYRVNDNITRWEMAKITLNLSWENVPNSCSWKYSDLKSSDWACKYAEAWNSYWFFASNTAFRPNDNITKVEALKMIMQARWIEKSNNSNWQAAYVEWAVTSWILPAAFTDYNTNAVRWWIFEIATNKKIDWIMEWDITNYDPIIENLLNELLNSTN